jgi:hypothetical protein
MRTAWLLLLVTMAGCNFGASEVQTIDNSCSDDSSCPTGVCDGDICVDSSGASTDLVIEVLRGSSDTLGVTPASWAFAANSVSGSSTLDLDLPATREVVGTVRWAGLRVPATLRFVRRMTAPVAPLAPVAVEVDTLREEVGGDGSEGYDFSTALVMGETYDVVVLPSSDMVMDPTQETGPAIRSLPPIYASLLVDDGDGSAPFRFDVVFPAELANDCTVFIDFGCTLEATVVSVDGQQEVPEAGLQVRAIDKETGRVLSSIGETDENGLFAIRISETAPDYLIRVTSTAGRTAFPAVSVDPDVAFADDPVKKRILIPSLDITQYTGSVRDMNDSPVPGATVRFLSTDLFGGNELGLAGSFTGSVTTDSEGGFGAELISGFYSITVTPPEDVENTWGVLSIDSLIGEGVTGPDALIVPSQIGLRGWVTTFRNETAGGVTILARARVNEYLGARSQEAVSNDIGAFAMSVDVGLYDIHVQTSPETGFAWLVDPEVVMSPEVGETVLGYRLEPPIPVQGVIRRHGSDTVPNALIRAYVLTGTDEATSRPIQVAETVSGEDGAYRLLIAPHLGDE